MTVTYIPLDGGHGMNLMVNGPRRDLAAFGYVEAEYTASGTAVSYVAEGEDDVAPEARADFTTRVVVRRPSDPAACNGTVVVEWMNVTAGTDVAANYAFTGDEVLRGGYVHVGVTAQAIAIEGGDAAIAIELAGRPAGLRASDPERYGSLSHPGDEYSYDIYSQVARALRDTPDAMLGGCVPQRILAVGESQSAFRLVTYVNVIHGHAQVFDGFLIHSRGRAAAGLAAGGPAEEAIAGDPVAVRDDGRTPVLIIEAEGDLLPPLNYLAARQDDSACIRTWEMAGTAHADRYSAGDIGELLGCSAPINDGPAHYLLKSALRHLDRWVAGDGPPPPAPRIDVDTEGAIARDEHGNARGGIRTPAVDVPVATLSGAPVGDVLICQLFGSTRRFDRDELVRLYGDEDTYVAAFDRALDRAVATGWVLPEDRAQFAAEARAISFG